MIAAAKGLAMTALGAFYRPGRSTAMWDEFNATVPCRPLTPTRGRGSHWPLSARRSS
jgi:hypothetical protein